MCRQQAGVQLKNFLYTNDESLRAQYEERWMNIPEDVRLYIKQNVVRTLGMGFNNQQGVPKNALKI